MCERIKKYRRPDKKLFTRRRQPPDRDSHTFSADMANRLCLLYREYVRKLETCRGTERKEGCETGETYRRRQSLVDIAAHRRAKDLFISQFI
jgi:hypothetical protein